MDYSHFDRQDAKKTLFITKRGLDNLKQRLDRIVHEKLDVVKRMRAMDQDDRDDQLMMSDEIRRLEAAESEAIRISDILQRAKPVTKPQHPTRIQVGSMVTLQTDTSLQTYVIVSSLEIDTSVASISEESPLGKALLDKEVNETVSLVTRKGERRSYTIVDVQ